MRKLITLNTLTLALLLLTASPLAQAYVGPGAGVTAIGALWAVILAILFAIGGILIWPIRAFLKRRKAAAAENNAETSADDNANG